MWGSLVICYIHPLNLHVKPCYNSSQGSLRSASKQQMPHVTSDRLVGNPALHLQRQGRSQWDFPENFAKACARML